MAKAKNSTAKKTAAKKPAKATAKPDLRELHHKLLIAKLEMKYLKGFYNDQEFENKTDTIAALRMAIEKMR